MQSDLLYLDKTHEYFQLKGTEKKKLISVTEVLSGMGLIDMRGVPAELLARAQKFGKALHYATALDDVCKLDESTVKDTMLRNHLESWRKFRKEWGYKFEENEIEQIMYHPLFLFAGTPDRYKIMGQELHIIDLKTSTSMYPSTALQVGGYELLICEILKRKFKKVIRLGVQTDDSGIAKVKEYKNPSDKSVFLSYLNTYKWELNNNIKRDWRHPARDTNQILGGITA